MTKTLFIVLLCTSLGGCATYRGEKLGSLPPPGDPAASVIPNGVPFVLTRPVYMLSRTVPADDTLPVYTIEVKNEADPKQYYSVRLKTAPFTDPDFLIKFADNGSIASTTSTTTEILTPAISALGSFVGNIISTKALGVFDKENLTTQITDVMRDQDHPIPACKAAPDLPGIKEEVLLSGTPVADVGDQLAAYFATFKRDKDFTEQFHYRTEGELSCLDGVKTTLAGLVTIDPATATKDWNDAEAAYLAKHADATAFATRVRTAVESHQTDQIKALVVEVKAQRKANAALARDQRVLLDKANRAIAALVFGDAIAQLNFFDNMDSKTWRARHTLYLEARLSELELLHLRDASIASSPKKFSAYRHLLGAFELERARTIGAVELYNRGQMLGAFLARVRDKAVDGGRAPATAEYTAIRQELDTVRAAIDAKRTKLMANAAPPPVPALPALTNLRVQAVGRDVIEASRKDGWANSQAGLDAANNAKYVLVLEEAE
jgi:hypothetical protein